ncbi:MAG TPA: GGDEF domain-containing protein [Candidatus Avacidaminococcus intestinavium]|uniref:GGDEF domain-containing protein n=1 Tax=Candidatus Avacidaminococcus intestinavium TaxID=2840684 RepID=A0A9D1MNJ6_9FIRM|nr:GGDEF domain-containing protein [Candidatus Avacidaminococcus intestinavium]
MKKIFEDNLLLTGGILGALVGASICALHYYGNLYFLSSRKLMFIFNTGLFCIIGILFARLIKKLKLVAMLDDMTQLWNKRYFNIRLAEEIERSKRKGTPLGLAYVDIDDFKGINNHYGHVVGDYVISNIADILRRNTRNLDIVVRWGGDEFVIVFPDTTPRYGFMIANRLQKAVLSSKDCYNATISIGFIDIDHNWDREDILEKVDELLIRAKKMKNIVVASDVIECLSR